MKCPWYDLLSNYCTIKHCKQYCKGEIILKDKNYYCSLDPESIRIGSEDEIIKALPKIINLKNLKSFLRG